MAIAITGTMIIMTIVTTIMAIMIVTKIKLIIKVDIMCVRVWAGCPDSFL